MEGRSWLIGPLVGLGASDSGGGRAGTVRVPGWLPVPLPAMCVLPWSWVREGLGSVGVEGVQAGPGGDQVFGPRPVVGEFQDAFAGVSDEAGGDGEEVLLQGAVDCWFQEDGGVVIVDYKSDRVTAEEVPERAALYAPQIRAYALAMAAVTGKKVRETVLYFLRPGIAFSDGKNP